MVLCDVSGIDKGGGFHVELLPGWMGVPLLTTSNFLVQVGDAPVLYMLPS